MNITVVLAVKNNLEYTKQFYTNFRKLYPEISLVISSGGSIDNTEKWLEKIRETDIWFSYKHTSNDISFSENYNIAISMVNTDKLVLVHNDMILGKNFLENLNNILSPGTLLSYTTIEPPIFPDHDRPGKLIKEFGRDFDSFDVESFNEYIGKDQSENLITEGISFFMSGYKSDFEEIGGFDGGTFNPYFCEDDDIIWRFKLNNKKLITTNKSLCYHFVSKTSRFSSEFESKTKSIELNSNRNFIRKWGNKVIPLKYDVGFIVKDINYNVLSLLEPYCSNIYVEKNAEELLYNYIDIEQKNTSFDLKERIKIIENNKPNNDILIEIFLQNFNEVDYMYIQHIPQIIKENNTGIFRLNNMIVNINNKNELQNKLIHCK